MLGIFLYCDSTFVIQRLWSMFDDTKLTKHELAFISTCLSFWSLISWKGGGGGKGRGVAGAEAGFLGSQGRTWVHEEPHEAREPRLASPGVFYRFSYRFSGWSSFGLLPSETHIYGRPCRRTRAHTKITRVHLRLLARKKAKAMQGRRLGRLLGRPLRRP